MIPDIINLANSSYMLWQESQKENFNQTPAAEKAKEKNQVAAQVVRNRNVNGYQAQALCYVDASWSSTTNICGYGWVLKNNNGGLNISAQGTMTPAANPLEAEAKALRTAVSQISRLGYSSVDFYTDSQQLSNLLQHANRSVGMSNDTPLLQSLKI